MQIIDYSRLNTAKPANHGQLTVEALVAALFFLVPALLFFVLSVH